MDGNAREYPEDYKYVYASESDYSRNDTLYEQFLVFSSYRFIMVVFVTVPLASFGLFGNVVSFLTFGKLALKNSVTFLLRALAINDLFILLCMVPVLCAEYTGEGISFRDNLCPSTTAVGLEIYTRLYIHPLLNFSMFCGTWTSVVIGMTRYIVVCRPLQAARLCTVSRARKQMLFITVFSIIDALPRFFEMEIRKKPDGSAYAVDALWGDNWYYYAYFYGFHIIAVFIVPFIMLLFCCVRLIAALRTASRQPIGRHGGNQVDTRISVMLVNLIAVFLFCQGFLWLYNILPFGPPITPCIDIKLLYMRVFLYALIIFNASVNCIIYLVYFKEFRRKLYTKWCHWLQPTGVR